MSANHYSSDPKSMGLSEMINSHTPRILITRLSHIGDCVLTLPLLNALRAAYPDAFIAWAVESPSHQLLSLHRGIDQLIKIPRGWMKSARSWVQIRRELKSYRFNLAIDPQGITKSSILGRLSGARFRIGASGRWGRELSPYLNNCLIEPIGRHLVDRSLELLDCLGIQAPRQPKFDLPVCSVSLEKMQRWVYAQGLQSKFTVINPGASWPSKRWETDRFAEVAKYIDRSHHRRSVVTWAGAEEQAMAERIVELAEGSAVMAPPTSLLELSALCKLAEFFIGCDTGPLHIAAGVGTTCIGLYGATRSDESGAYGRQHIAVQKWYQKGTCRARRKADNLAMRDIQPHDVFQAVEEIMNRAAVAQTKAG